MKPKESLFVNLMLVVMASVISGLVFRGISAAEHTTHDRNQQDENGLQLCPPLDPANGSVIHVSTVAEIQAAVNNASSGDTILAADGTYGLDGVYLRIDEPGLTVRSASGNRDAVILDGNYITTEIIQIAASHVTIADITLREAFNHPIHVMSTASDDAKNSIIYNVHIIDPGEQALKINPASDGRFPDEGLVACSHIELTDAGRPHIRSSCYTGGIDAHQARGWVVRDNLIEGFWCQSGLSEHAVHFWRGSRDTVVERNRIRDNARGIGFGLVTSGSGRTYADKPCPTVGDGYVDHYDGIIRNNFIFTGREELFSSDFGFDCAICIWQACGTQVFHNSVGSTKPPFSSIEWRFGQTGIEIKNNVMSHNLRDRGGTAVLANNVENTPLSVFIDGPGGDLHLRSDAFSLINQGILLADVLEDIDGDARPMGSCPDIGAVEFGLSLPNPVKDLWVYSALQQGGTVTATLTWKAPSNAMTVTLRYDYLPLTNSSWAGALIFGSALPGSAESHTGALPYKGGILYFAVKTQNSDGAWSGLSNNAFWPIQYITLPLVAKD